MKRKLFSWLAVLTLLCGLLPLSAWGEAAPAYKITLPDGYAEETRRFPVLYLLPQDGYNADDSGLEALLIAGMKARQGMEMLIVRPVLTEGSDAAETLRQVAAAVDSQYRTAADPACRTLIGTGAGGYLAYALLLREESPFGAAVSIRGDFAGEANPWIGVYGSVKERIEALHAADEKYFDGVYTYMDAPVEDPWTDLPGSTDDLGALMIGYGTGSAFHEFTVRPGVYDEAFAAESVRRVLDRLTSRILSGAAGGTVKMEKSVLTADDASVSALCTVKIGESIRSLAEGELSLIISAQMLDPETREVLASSGVHQMVPGPGEYTETLELTNAVAGGSATVELSVDLLDTPITLASASLILARDPIIDGDYQQIDLMGDWHFQYMGAQALLDAAALTPAEFDAWPVVQPGLAWWEKGFGNISDENVKSGYGPDYFNYFITGSGYYARTFTVPEGFDAKEAELAVGYVDDRCEVYLNGTRVGATGLDEKGLPTGDTTWAVFSHFAIDHALLNIGGENILVVRAWNDLPFGAGGWYAGPVGLYSKTAFDAQYGEAASARFYEETFESAWAARAQGLVGAVENKYLIYLPESYAASDRFYPTVYLLHQFNSDHTSYRTDHVDKLLDEGAKAGLFDEMIVVIPNSSEESWWRGDWEKMITEELIPLIESRYRAIPDARCRLTAGCSMGGQGAYGVALRNPDYFTGAVSFFGAFSYGGESSPNAIAAKEPAEYLRNYALYFACGNQDSYGFGKPAIQLHQQLTALNVAHAFFIENGGHDSGFYVPFFQEGLAYARAHMYRSDPAIENLLTGSLTWAEGALRAEVSADAGIAGYLYAAPTSSYTRQGTQALRVPLTVELIQNGETAAILINRDAAFTAESLTAAADFTPDAAFRPELGFTAVLKANILDRTVTLVTLEVPAR